MLIARVPRHGRRRSRLRFGFVTMLVVAAPISPNRGRSWCFGPRSPLHQMQGPRPSSARGWQRALALRGATVVDVADGMLRSDQTVLIVGNRIAYVGPRRRVRLPAGTRIVDARGRYLIPGLWDMHSHPLNYAHIFYPLLIAHGVTGMREPGTGVPLVAVQQWRREIAAGARIGPRVVVGGYVQNECSDANTAAGGPMCNVIAAADAASHVIDSLHAVGADFIKVHGFASDAVYFAIAAAARRAGIPFGGHVDGGVSAVTMSDSGASILDHYQTWAGSLPMCFGDSASVMACTPVAARLTRNHTWLVTTLAVHAARAHLSLGEARRNLRYWPDSVHSPMTACDSCLRSFLARQRDPFAGQPFAVAGRADVPLVAGTDIFPPQASYVAPGAALHTELALLVEKGLTPLAALQAATLNPAKALRATDSLGTIEPGKLADLVLLDADPLADIHNTTKIRAVVANGRYFDRSALDRLLAGLVQRVTRSAAP